MTSSLKRARASGGISPLGAYWLKCLADDSQTLRRSTPKRYRPRCNQPCRDGHPCQAPVLWDKEHNRPASDRCFRHAVAGWPSKR